MRRRKLTRLIAFATLLAGLPGCSVHQLRETGATIARGTIDSLLGFPAVSVIAGAGNVLEAGEDAAHEQEVEELASAYDAFIEDRHAADLPADPARPVVIGAPGNTQPYAGN